MKIFIVNGSGGAGKDTVEKMICDIATKDNKKIAKISTIDYIKTIAKLFGWRGEKELKDRKMLCDLKKLLTEWKDIPYQKVCDEIRLYTAANYDAIFIDCREPEEIKRFVDDFNALTLLVKRSSIQLIYDNAADDNVENYEYDCIIDNSRGLFELQQEAEIFYDTFIKGEDKSEV